MKKSAGRQIERELARQFRNEEPDWRILHRQAVEEGLKVDSDSEQDIQHFLSEKGRRLIEEQVLLAGADALGPRIDVYVLDTDDDAPHGPDEGALELPTWTRQECLCGTPHFYPAGRQSLDERMDRRLAELGGPSIAVWHVSGQPEDDGIPEALLYIRHSRGGYAACVLTSVGPHRVPLESEIPQAIFSEMFRMDVGAVDMLAEPFRSLRPKCLGAMNECIEQIRTGGVEAPALSDAQWRALVGWTLADDRLLPACLESGHIVADAHESPLRGLLEIAHRLAHKNAKQVRDAIAQLERDAKAESERRRTRFQADMSKARQITEGIRSRANRLERELKETQELLRASQLGKVDAGRPAPGDRVRIALDALF